MYNSIMTITVQCQKCKESGSASSFEDACDIIDHSVRSVKCPGGPNVKYYTIEKPKTMVEDVKTMIEKDPVIFDKLKHKKQNQPQKKTPKTH